MLKEIDAQKDRASAAQKSMSVAEKLRPMRMLKEAEIVRKGVDETLSSMASPREHWRRLWTDNPK